MQRIKAWLRRWLEVPHLPLIEEDQGNLQGHLIELESKLASIRSHTEAYQRRSRQDYLNLTSRVSTLEKLS